MALKSASDGTERKRIEWLPENKLCASGVARAHLRANTNAMGKTPEGLIRPGGSPPRPRRTGAAGHSAALAARERGPSAVDAGVASTRAARSNRLVRGLLYYNCERSTDCKSGGARTEKAPKHPGWAHTTVGPRPGPRAPGRPLPPAARLPGLPGCPLRELELGNTTCPPCPQKGKVAISPSRR